MTNNEELQVIKTVGENGEEIEISKIGEEEDIQFASSAVEEVGETVVTEDIFEGSTEESFDKEEEEFGEYPELSDDEEI